MANLEKDPDTGKFDYILFSFTNNFGTIEPLEGWEIIAEMTKSSLARPDARVHYYVLRKPHTGCWHRLSIKEDLRVQYDEFEYLFDYSINNQDAEASVFKPNDDYVGKFRVDNCLPMNAHHESPFYPLEACGVNLVPYSD